MIKVSVVILNWNGADMLRRFLPSVISCSQGEGIEVCVADNGSSDDSCRLVEGEFPSVRLIRLPENYGFADGYNKALEQVDAEYVVLLNSDVEVSSDWLSAMVSYMDLHPEVAACQPKILDWKNKEYFEYAEERLPRIFFLQCGPTYMIDYALRQANQLIATAAQTPAQVYFFHMCKETSVESPCFPIFVKPDK